MERHPWKFGRPVSAGGFFGACLLLLPALSAQAQDKTRADRLALRSITAKRKAEDQEGRQ